MLAQLFDPSRYSFNPLAFQTQSVAFTAFVLGVFMLGRELDRRTRTSFFVLTTAVSWWLFAFSRMYAAADPRLALFWAKAAYLGVAFIPAADYTFSATVLRDWDRVRPLMIASWIVSALFCVQLLATDTAFGDLHRYAWGCYPRFRLPAVAFTLYCIGMIGYVLVRFSRVARRTASAAPGGGMAWQVPAAFAGGALAIIDFAPAFGLPVYPAGFLLIFLFVIMSVYLMAARRFPDIVPGVVASQVIETMQDALLVVDRHGTVSFVNRAACVMLGEEASRIMGRRIDGAAGGNRVLLAEIESSVRSGRACKREISYPCQDGSERTVRFSRSVIRDWTGDALFHVCALHDITERIRTEWALAESNAGTARQLKFTETLLKTEPVAVFFKDAAGRYLGCNEEFSRIVGVSPEDIKGKTVFDLWPKELAAKYHEQDRALIAHPGHQKYEFAVPGAQGNLIDVIFTKDVFTDEKGTVQGIIGTFVDITDRKRAEAEITRLNETLERKVEERTAQLVQVNDTLQAEIEERLRIEEELRTSKLFLHNILNSIQDPIVVLDRNRYVLLANRTFEGDFIGAGDTAYVGKHCHEVLFGSPDPCGTCLAEESTRSGTVSRKVLSTADGNGAARWFDVFAYPLFTTDGLVAGNVHQLRDITERKKAEATIARNQEQLRSLTRQLLASEEQERKRIARELHDEMGQMLTGVKLGLQEVVRLSKSDVGAKVTDIQQDIGELMVRMRDLSARLRPTVLDDLGLIPALQWHAERLTKQTGMRVVLEHHGTALDLSHETSLTLFRIVQEALTNAVRHSGADRVFVTIQDEQRHIRVTIRDEGGGFDPEAALNAGATLGLAGMRERVEMAGGELSITSAPERGTEISCMLPVGRQEDSGERRVQ